MNEIQKIPRCVAITMDGNRRWAREQGLSTLAGHKAGYLKFKEVVRWGKEAKIEYLEFYAFSTENWKRGDEEVGHIMNLFEMALIDCLRNFIDDKVRMRFIGEHFRFSSKLQNLIKKVEKVTENYTDTTVVLALSYGGRREIVTAVNKLIAENRREPVGEAEFREHYLWSKDIPDPDIAIRTGGEKRLSNFLLWQMAYTELFFTDTLWPDFSKEEFYRILEEFAVRDQHHGR